MKSIVFTNNPMVASFAANAIFVDGSAADVYIKVRDALHKGARLLTHPLAGNLPPEKAIYRSVAVVQAEGPCDFESVELIETAIAKTTAAAQADPAGTSSGVLADLQLMDFCLIKSACSVLKHAPEGNPSLSR